MATTAIVPYTDRFSVTENPPARQTSNDNGSLEEYLRGVCKQWERVARPGRVGRWYIWSQNEMFYRGMQLYTFDALEGEWEEWPEDLQDLYHAINLVLPFVEMNTSEYTKSKPRLVIYSEAGDDRKIAQAVQEAQHLADCLQERLWQPENVQREAKIVQFRGAVFTQVYRDPARGPKVRVPRLKNDSVMTPARYACPECGSTGVAEGERGNGQREEPAGVICPDCGGEAMISPGTEIPTLQVEGYDEMHEGEIVAGFADPFQVEISNRAKTPEESPWLKFDEILPNSLLQQMYPHVEVGRFSESGDWKERSGLYFLRQLELAIGNTGELDQSDPYYGYDSHRQTTDELHSLHTLVWLEHHGYCNYTLKHPTQLPGTNKILPAGAKLGDVFPDGLKICFVNGTIVKLGNEAKNDRWSGYKYQVTGAGFFGVTIENIISINRAYNETGSIQLAWALMASLGLTVADASRMKDGQFVNKPGYVNTLVDRQYDEPIENIVHHISTQGPGGEVEVIKQDLKADGHLVSGARSPNTSGLTPEGMRTARGVSYQQAVMDSFAGARLELMAWCRARQIEQAINLYRKHQVRPRWFSKFGETIGKWLDPLNIPGDLRCRVEPDSAYPRTNEDVRRDTANAMGLGWGTGHNQPHVDEHISTVFNLPKGPNDYDDWKVKAARRLDALKYGYEAATDFGIAGETAIEFMIEQMIKVCRPNAKLDSHQAFIRFWTEYYLSDEYDELPLEVQAAIDMLVTEHEFAMYEEMQEKMMAEDAVVDPLKQKARAEADRDAEKQDRREGRRQIRSAAIGAATSKPKPGGKQQ